MKTIKSILAFIGCVAVVGMLYAFTSKTYTNHKMESQSQWENLKVLPQDISKDSLESLMNGYNISLGVKCSYCHAPKEGDPTKLNFSDDSKQAKLIARGMIQMTDEINDHYFLPYYPDPKPAQAGDINCLTCHRGNAKPNEYLKGVGSLFKD